MTGVLSLEDGRRCRVSARKRNDLQCNVSIVRMRPMHIQEAALQTLVALDDAAVRCEHRHSTVCQPHGAHHHALCARDADIEHPPRPRVLIANRGEIARRVIRTCKAHDIHTIAIYTDVDVLSPHVKEASIAVGLGSNVRDYTNKEKLVEVRTSAANIRL